MKLLLIILSLSIISNAKYIKEKIFNENIYVQSYGNPNNETLLFVHGLGDEASSIWDKTILTLIDKYHIVVFDFPGFGKSSKSSALYSVDNYSKIIDTIVNLEIKKKFHLIGHSMGGAISLIYAAKNQEKLKSLVLIDAAGILLKESYTKSIAKEQLNDIYGINFNKFKITEKLINIPSKLESFIPFSIESMISNKTIRESLFQKDPTTTSAISLVNKNFTNIPNSIRINTKIIWGEEDNIAPLKTAYVLNKLIKKSDLSIISKAKHVPMSDSFDKYIFLLKKHLKSHNYSKKLTTYNNTKKDINYINKTNVTVSGNINNLYIKNSHKIVIKNARINYLIIDNSSIKIINSNITLNDKSSILNSSVEIISSKLNTTKTINVLDSHIDISAVDIRSSNKLFKNLNELDEQKVLFSLSKLNGKDIHKVVKINKFDEF